MAMTLRPTEADEKLLATLAQRWGLSKNEAALRAIREAAEREAEVDFMKVFLEGTVAYAQTLERLAQ